MAFSAKACFQEYSQWNSAGEPSKPGGSSILSFGGGHLFPSSLHASLWMSPPASPTSQVNKDCLPEGRFITSFSALIIHSSIIGFPGNLDFRIIVWLKAYSNSLLFIMCPGEGMEGWWGEGGRKRLLTFKLFSQMVLLKVLFLQMKSSIAFSDNAAHFTTYLTSCPLWKPIENMSCSLLLVFYRSHDWNRLEEGTGVMDEFQCLRMACLLSANPV